MLSIWSFTMAVLIGSLSICLFYFITKRTPYINSLGISALLIFLLCILTRILVPIELPFTRVIPSTIVLPKIYSFMRAPLYTFHNHLSINVLSLIIFIWSLGILINLIQLMKDYYYLNKSFRHLNTYKHIDEDTWDKLSKEYKIPKNLRIIETEVVSTPFVYGFIHPTILFPSYPFNPEEQYFTLKHELEHLKQKHIWIKLVIEIACIIYWWNPLVYRLRKQADHLLELSVDKQISLSWDEEEKLTYLAFLIDTYKKSITPNIQNNLHLALDLACTRMKSSLSKRCELLSLSIQKRNSTGKTFVTYLLLLLLLLASFSFVLQPRYSLPNEYEANLFLLTPDNAYLIENDDGFYDVYSYVQGYLTTVLFIEEPYSDLPIFATESEANSQ